jgi:hypothetical protein
MISLLPAAPNSCPVIDFVELTYGLLPKILAIACASATSPTGVDVACALM